MSASALFQYKDCLSRHMGIPICKIDSTMFSLLWDGLMAPTHYLDQCWLFISKVQWYFSEGNFTEDISANNQMASLYWDILQGINSHDIDLFLLGPFYWRGLTLIPAWISNHMPSNFIPHYNGHNYLSMQELKLKHVSVKGPWIWLVAAQKGLIQEVTRSMQTITTSLS